MSGRSVISLVAAILLIASVQVGATTLGITSDGRFFTMDGVPTYLNGISYYSGNSIATPSWVTSDLDDMVARKINWIRVWAFWNGTSGSNAVSACYLDGTVREPYMSRLKTIITEANSRGIIVDVTMDRDSSKSTMAQYTACAQTLATQLLPYRNVYIDVANERDVGDTRYVSISDCGALIAAIKAIDPGRICTASGCPSSQSDMDSYLNVGHLDFIATHLCRDASCPAQTYGTVRQYVAWMTAIGKRVPEHLQEPLRRGYTSYEPVQEDFYRDDSGAKAAEAAGWCLHNGSGDGLNRSFWMGPDSTRLFLGLDSVELDTAANMDDAIGSTSWKVRRYQAEYSEQISHTVGRKEGLFWSANMSQDVAGYMTYGPYLNGIGAGNYRVAWRMMIDNNSGNDIVATVDVSSGGTVIAQRNIRRQEFTASNTWQTFNVDYVGAGQQNLEFRTYYYDNCYLKLDHITLSQDAPPDTPIGFAAVPGNGQVTLSWTNPMSPNFTGTMIRFKTTGYPTSPTDGALLCDRAGAPSSSDGYIHTGLTSPMYFYAAFAHDATGQYSPAVSASASPRVPSDWVSEDFNGYSNGDLTNQGDWATTGGAHSQVESTFTKSGSARAVVMDCIASGGASIGDQIAFTDKSSGYYYLTVDVAQNTASTTSNQDIAYVSVYGSSSTTEVVKLHIQRGRLMCEGAATSLVSTGIANNNWNSIKIGLNVDTKKYDLWMDGSQKISNLTWKGAGTNISKIVISSDRNTTLTTQQAFIDNLMFDVRPGAVASATDDGAWTPSQTKLHFTFPAVSGAGEYHYAIGTTSGGTQTRDWTSCGTSTDYIASGLSLAENTTYYVSVQAGTGHGIWGAGANTNGIKVAPGVATINGAKALADGTSTATKALRGKLVSAAFTGYFYVQEPTDPFGLKVVSASTVNPGDQVDVAGYMQGSASERYIDCTGNGVIKVTGPGGPYPLSLTSASVGGIDLNGYTHGVANGLGPNNVGLYVTACGKVTQRQTTAPTYFYIDDGCGLKDGTTTGGVANVGVRIPGDPASYAEGSYVAVKGIVSNFTSSGLRPQILPAQIQILRAP